MKKSSIITGICLFLLGSFSCKTSTGIYSVLPKKSYPALSGDIYVYSAYDCDCRKKAYIGEGYYTSKSQLYRVPDDLAERCGASAATGFTRIIRNKAPKKRKREQQSGAAEPNTMS